MKFSMHRIETIHRKIRIGIHSGGIMGGAAYGLETQDGCLDCGKSWPKNCSPMPFQDECPGPSAKGGAMAFLEAVGILP